MSASAKIILDSVAPCGVRLTTMEIRYWRAIHAEIMTHRDRARNAASSRAIPFYRTKAMTHEGVVIEKPVANCTWSFIKDDPFFPEFIGSEQKGMQSGDELMEPNREKALQIIDSMRKFSLGCCRELFDLGVHKSVINRYLEPWSYITVVMTATDWKNFFRLRIHPKAEKHFNQLAVLMKAALEASTPKEVISGDWHMPYLVPEDFPNGVANVTALTESQLGDLTKVSAARCARVSYLTQDGRRDQGEDLKLFSSLIHPKKDDGTDDETIHASPLEHVCQASASASLRSGPFRGWYQMRKDYPNESLPG